MNLAHDRLAAMIYRRRFFNSLAFRYQAGDSLAGLGATFTRASTATYIDANGVLQTAASGVARDGHYINGVRTLLLEGQRTNSFLNSGTPATHTSPSLGTGSFTLWMVGTGSIAVAGGTATITGAGTATAASPVTFTVTVAGTVTFTVTGTPTRAQCENGAFASSYIATTGSAVTRSADNLSFLWVYVPQAATTYVSAFENGQLQVASALLWKIDNSGANGVPQARVINAGGIYAANHFNGVSSVASNPGVSPAFGNAFEYRSVIDTDGSVLAGQSIGGAAEVLGTKSGALSFAAAWAGPPTTFGVALAGGFGIIRSIKVALGAQSLATMKAL